MSKEMMYVRFLQISVTLMTFIFIYGISQAKKGNIDLHKKINGGLLIVTALAVVGLIVTMVVFGFNYRNLCEPWEMNTHRAFSTPLFFTLIATAYYGAKNNAPKHKLFAKLSAFFWLGTLITALIFFHEPPAA